MVLGLAGFGEDGGGAFDEFEGGFFLGVTAFLLEEQAFEVFEFAGGGDVVAHAGLLVEGVGFGGVVEFLQAGLLVIGGGEFVLEAGDVTLDGFDDEFGVLFDLGAFGEDGGVFAPET
jgi:hypothetical protein